MHLRMATGTRTTVLRLDEGFRVSATITGRRSEGTARAQLPPELVTPFPAQRGLQPFGVIA